MLKVKGNHNCITTDPEFVDKDQDGVDDRDEWAGGHQLCPEFIQAVAGFIASVTHDLFFGSSLDTKMNDRATDLLLAPSFRNKGLIATRQQRQALEQSGERLEDAIVRARQTPDSDSFLKLCDARMQRKIAATDMIMNDAAARGDTARYNEAKAHNDRFKNIRHDIGVLQQRMAGEPDEEKKQAEIKALMPGMWDRFKNGDLTTDDGGVMNGWTRPGTAPKSAGDPFWSTLSGLFRLAGFNLPSPTPATAQPSSGPVFQPT